MGTGPHEGRLWLGIFQYQRSCLSSISWFKRRLTEVKLTRCPNKPHFVTQFFYFFIDCCLSHKPNACLFTRLQGEHCKDWTDDRKTFIFFRFAVMRYLDLNFDLQPLPSLGEDTEYNRSLHFVLCVNNTVRHKKTFLGIIFWTQTR